MGQIPRSTERISSSTDDRRQFITLSVRHCVQHDNTMSMMQHVVQVIQFE